MRTVSDQMPPANHQARHGVPAVAAAQPFRAAAWFPPGVMHWRGNATGSWWAFVPGVDHFVEAATESALAAEVRRVMAGGRA